MVNIIKVTDLTAPELAVYTQLTQAQLRSRVAPERALFIAESPKVIGTALDAGCQPVSFLMEREKITGQASALLDRLFYSCSDRLAYKPAAAVAVCRRGGASATFDRLNKYFTISNMPVVSSQYWNSVHGRLPGEAAQDAEGLQTMRVLARNMARMLRAGLLASEGRPEPEERVVTSFIR